MDLVDTHCHIQSINTDLGESETRQLWSKFNLSSKEVIERAVQDNVTKMIVVGCDLFDSQQAVNFANQHSNVWASIGIHPHEANKYVQDQSFIQEFKELLKSPKVVAIGECGLDYFYKHSTPSDQSHILKIQVELAVQFNLPVIFHVRNAFNDFWPIFDEINDKHKIRGVLHSFTDNQENLDRAIQKGLYIGVNGIATFTKDEDQIELYRKLPLSNLLLETDAPFLTPAPIRGSINEPKNIRLIVEYLSNLRGEEVDKVAEMTSINSSKLFNI